MKNTTEIYINSAHVHIMGTHYIAIHANLNGMQIKKLGRGSTMPSGHLRYVVDNVTTIFDEGV